MDHDGYFDEPDALQGLLLSEYVSEGTNITAAPALLQRLLWAAVCPFARALGRDAVDDTYLDPAFWRPSGNPTCNALTRGRLGPRPTDLLNETNRRGE